VPQLEQARIIQANQKVAEEQENDYEEVNGSGMRGLLAKTGEQKKRKS